MLTRFKNTLSKVAAAPGERSLLRDQRGLTTVEYIIILCLIAVVGFGVWKKFGEKVKEKVGGSTEQVDALPTTTEE
jgi:Flp pilus assembly pilin Flp